MLVRTVSVAAVFVLAGLFTGVGPASADDINVGSEVPGSLASVACIPQEAQPIGVSLEGMLCEDQP